MIAVMEQPVNVGGPGTIAPSDHARRIVSDSATRWVIQFFKDIDFMRPTGRGMQNSIQPEIGDEGELIFCGMRRCTPYPLVNHEYNVVAHEQIGFDGPPNYSGGGLGEALETQPINAPKYARVCAEELMFQYGAEFGLVTPDALIGASEDVVREVFAVLQPYAYKLHNLEHELMVGASVRAAEVKDKDVVVNGEVRKFSDVVERTRRIMLVGAQRAINTGREQYGEYYKDTQSFVGSKKGRSFPLDHDRFVADQLGLELPLVVQTPAQQGDNPKVVELLKKLTESAVQKVSDADQTATRLATMEAGREVERAETAELKRQMAEFLASQSKPEKKAK